MSEQIPEEYWGECPHLGGRGLRAAAWPLNGAYGWVLGDRVRYILFDEEKVGVAIGATHSGFIQAEGFKPRDFWYVCVQLDGGVTETVPVSIVDLA